MTTLTLQKPIQAHGEEVKVLTFREPTGRDIRLAGVPFAVEGGGGRKANARFDAAITAQLISSLANIPMSSVDKLSAPDWTAAMGIVVGFFGATSLATSSTDTSTSPGSGETSSTPSA